MKYQKKWLDVPSLSQGNPCGFGGDWCGRTSAAMIFNYFEKVAGKPDSALVVNDEEKKDLVYPDGGVAADGYVLGQPLDKSVRGWTRKALFPVETRGTGAVSEQKQLEILSPVFNSLERNVPLLLYSGISNNQSTPRHLIVICGYWSRADGVWLMMADPATMGGSGAGLTKIGELGEHNVEVLEAGSWQNTGCSYWIKASRLFELNERSSGAADRRSAGGAGSKADADDADWDQDQDRWCDHCNRPGFVVFLHETHEAPESDHSHAETGLFFPMEGKTAVDADAVAAYHKHIEVDHGGGYYPLGTNTVWHGGVHLHLEKGSKVHATFAGEIVAARLPDAEDKAFGHYGSHNFVLVRHRREAEVFYALYVHLNNEALDADSATLEEIPWLTTTKTTAGEKKPHVRVKVNLSYRSAPRVANDTYLGTLKKGAAFPWIATEGVWHKIDYKGDEVWTSARSAYSEKLDLGAAPTSEIVVDEELLSQLKTGKVVKLNRPLQTGSVLWTAGEYGSEGHRTGLLHWEVFSENLLFPDWKQIVDEDEDFNVDSKKIIALVPQSDGYWEDDEILTSEELRKFYRESENAKELRSYACKFVSEWGVDLGPAISKLKKAWYKTIGLEDRMRPYLWWDEAKAAGVELPANKHVWHYNPVALVDAFRDDTLPTSVAASPAVESEGEDENPNEDEESSDLNSFVLEVIADYEEEYHTKGYFWPSSGNWQGNIQDTYYDGVKLGTGSPQNLSYCCGITWEIFLEATRRFYEAKGKPHKIPGIERSQLNSLRGPWFVFGSVEAEKRGAPQGIKSAGIGKIVSHAEAKPGDFAQIFKDDNRAAGHWIIITKALENGEIETWSSEGWRSEEPILTHGCKKVNRKVSDIHTLEIARVVLED